MSREFMQISPGCAAEFYYSVQLLRNINETGEAAFSGNTSCNRKELLLFLVYRIAFNFTEGGTSRCTSGVSSLGNLSHVRSCVFTCQQLQAALRNNAFVIAMGNEEIKAGRTSYRDLRVGQRP